MSTIIEVKDLNLWYGTHHALHSVNIAIPEHEITPYTISFPFKYSSTIESMALISS